MGIRWENTALGTEFVHNFCAGISGVAARHCAFLFTTTVITARKIVGEKMKYFGGLNVGGKIITSFHPLQLGGVL